MGRRTPTVLLLLAFLASCNAFYTLVPPGKELIYEYQAIVKAGTHIPVSHASQFVLIGKLHIQSNGNASLVQLTDLKYQLYNGVLDHVSEHEVKDLPLPSEVEGLQNVFKVVYDENGKALGIAVSDKDKEYVVNIKKGIATILQLDIKQIQSQKLPHAFVNLEKSIYGLGAVQYNVLPQHDDIVVQKMLVMPNFKNLFTHSITPTTSECDAPFEEPVSRDSQRKYLIVPEGGKNVVKHIEANGGIYYHPFVGKSEAQYVLVNQTFELLNIIPVTNQLQVVSEHFIHTLSYHWIDEEEHSETIPDISNGRRVVDGKALVPVALQMLQDIWAYLHKDHLHKNTPNIEQGQLINRIEKVLVHLDTNTLNELYTQVLKQPVHIQNVFYELLPLVGTKSSVLLIKKLIEENKLEESIAIDLLQVMPKHIKAPSHNLVSSLEVLLNLNENISWEIRKVAILSFANILGWAYDFSLQVHNNEHMDEYVNQYIHENSNHHIQENIVSELLHLEVNEENEDIKKFFEKFVVQIVNKLKSVKDHEQQMTYLAALTNIQIDIVLPHVVPIIKGEVWPDHHHRLFALWSLAGFTEKHQTEIYEILWPILANVHEHTELRIAAYYMIMELLPSSVTFTNIYWLLKHETNVELYHFHWSYMNSLAKRTDSCYSIMKVSAAQLLKYMNPPKHGVSQYNIYDFTDIKYKWGMGLHGLYIQTNESIILNGFVSSQIFNIYNEELMVNVKIHGLDNNMDILKINNIENDKFIEFNKDLVKLLSAADPKALEDVHIEVTIMHHEEIINVWYIEGKSVNENHVSTLPFTTWLKGGSTYETQLLIIEYDRYSKTFIPTDLGLPAVWDLIMPSVQLSNIKMTKEVVNNVLNLHIDNQVVSWVHSRHGLSVYNPIPDVWQGVNKYHSYDTVLPTLLDVNINIPQQSVQISLKKHQDTKKDVWGLRSHVTTMVFVKDEHNLLVQSSPKSKNFVIVSNGNQFRHDYNLWTENDIYSGRNWDIVAYDSEYPVSNGSFGYAKFLISQPFTKNFNDPLEHLILTYLNWDSYLLMQPVPTTHGILIRAVPDNDISSVDLSFRWNLDIKPEGYVYTPGMKITTRLTYAIKNQEKSLKTWDVNTVVDLNPGHTVNNLKMHISRIVPGQKDYVICIDGVKKWSLQGITGHLNVAMSQSTDGKCVKDDTVIDVTMTGEKSLEQIEGGHFVSQCQYTIPYSVDYFNTLDCLISQSSLRKYVYNVKTTNVPTEFKKYFLNILEFIKAYNLPYFNWEHEHTVDVGENNLKIEVDYPLSNPVVDINVYTHQHEYSLTGLPLWYWKWWGLEPESVQYPALFLILQDSDVVKHCEIDHQSLLLNHNVHKDHAVTQDWSLYLGDVAQSPKHALYVKEVSAHHIGLKIVDNQHVLEIIPHEHVLKIVLDGQPVTTDKSLHVEEWVSWSIITRGVTQTIAVVLSHSGLVVEFDGVHVNTVIPQVVQGWHGLCVL